MTDLADNLSRLPLSFRMFQMYQVLAGSGGMWAQVLRRGLRYNLTDKANINPAEMLSKLAIIVVRYLKYLSLGALDRGELKLAKDKFQFWSNQRANDFQ